MQTKALVQSASFRCLLASGLYKVHFTSKGSYFHLLTPTYVGFFVPSIHSVQSNGTTITFKSGNTLVSLWLSVQSVHISIL